MNKRKNKKKVIMQKNVLYITFDKSGRRFFRNRDEAILTNNTQFFSVEYMAEYRGKTDVLKITDMNNKSVSFVTNQGTEMYIKYEPCLSKKRKNDVWSEKRPNTLRAIYNYIENEMGIKLRNTVFAREAAFKRAVYEYQKENNMV